MKILLSFAFILAFCAVGFPQKRVANLNPAHAVALEEFLSKNKDYGFMSETILDSEYLKYMRKFLKNLRPYYIVGDFNRDKVFDFAMILSRKGVPSDNGEGTDEVHRFDYPLSIIIFNGDKKGKFHQAFIEDIESPTACFLNVEKKELFFGVFESDADTRIFAPVGKGYIVEYPKSP